MQTFKNANDPSNLIPIPGTVTAAVVTTNVASTLATLLAAAGATALDPKTKLILVSIEAAAVRYAPEGGVGVPTTAIGQLLGPGSGNAISFIIGLSEFNAGKYISAAAGVPATLQISQYTYNQA